MFHSYFKLWSMGSHSVKSEDNEKIGKKKKLSFNCPFQCNPIIKTILMNPWPPVHQPTWELVPQRLDHLLQSVIATYLLGFFYFHQIPVPAGYDKLKKVRIWDVSNPYLTLELVSSMFVSWYLVIYYSIILDMLEHLYLYPYPYGT